MLFSRASLMFFEGFRSSAYPISPRARITASNPPVDQARHAAGNDHDCQIEQLASIAQSDCVDRKGESDDQAERHVRKYLADAEDFANSDDEQSWD